MRCPRCEVDAPLALAGPVETTVGTVAAVLERRPVVACPDRHEATPPEVSGAAMEAAEASIPRARARWLRGDVCRSCGATLDMPVRRTQRAVTVELTRHAPLTVRFDLPMTRCPACGADQVPSRSQEDLVVVVPALFAGV